MNIQKLMIYAFLAVFFFGTFPALAGTYLGEVLFSMDDLSIEKICGFDFIYLKGAGYTAPPGAPNLPGVQVNVALPLDAQVLGVKVLHVDSKELDGRYDIMPAAEPRRISDPPPVNPFVKNASIYERDAYHPGVRAEILGSWELYGQDFVTLNLYPVEYNPITGKLRLHTRMEFKVDYRESTSPFRQTYNFTKKMRKSIHQRLRAMAVNPQDVTPLPNYVAPLTTALEPGQYEYVIVAPASFVSSFQPLADWRTQMGMPAKIVTLDWIYANYTGTSNREEIKLFMKDATPNWGTMYYLLGGDTGQVPYHIKTVTKEAIPNDTYYARLNLETISWKYNTYVGRACATNTSQVNDFVDKVLSYEKNPPANFGDKVFMMGFDLDSKTPTELLMEKIKNNWLPAWSDYSSEYDSESGGHESDVKSYISAGQNLVNHSDHCNTSYLGTGSVNHGQGLSNSEAASFTNGTKYCNLYTLGCYAGNYPSTCWGEALVRDDQGGITFVGNSRYGWYSSGCPYCYSATYCQKWWEALYSSEFNAYRAGETLAVSLNNYFPGPDIMKYIFTELNLLGDPGLHFWTDEPAVLTVIHDASIYTGMQTFTVSVEDNGSPVADALVCVMKDSEVYAFETTDASGAVGFSIDPASTGTMIVTVTGQNYKHYEGSVSVTLYTTPPDIHAVSPRYGMEAGSTPVTITGADFTASTSVKIAGIDCTSVNMVDPNTLTCLTPPGTDGWCDVEVSNTYGSDTLVDGFRYFPVGGNPFNGTDVQTDALDAPADVVVIASGQPLDMYMLFFSYGGGPSTTPFGTMGLTMPIQNLFTAYMNQDGYSMIPLSLQPGFGPLDFYLQVLGLDGGGAPLWAYGGNNPNGSGSIWIHLNN